MIMMMMMIVITTMLIIAIVIITIIIVINNNNDNNNNNKVDVQFPYSLVWKLHTQACEIVAGTKRKLCKKFQVDISKLKK